MLPWLDSRQEWENVSGEDSVAKNVARCSLWIPCVIEHEDSGRPSCQYRGENAAPRPKDESGVNIDK